jgi:hypothetical protein
MNHPCPVCYAPMETYSDYLDGHTLLESYEECPHGCYVYRYGYGNTEMMVNIRGHKILFGHSYQDKQEDIKADWAAVEELFEPARKALIEDLRAKVAIFSGPQ